VLHAQDRAGLLDLLGVTATALVAVSTAGVSGGSAAHEAPAASMLRAEALALGGEPGVALVAHDGELAAWLHVRASQDGRFEPVVCVAARDGASVISAANRMFGGDAVRKLLARLAAADGAACVATPGVGDVGSITCATSTMHACATTLAQALVVA